MNESRLVTHSGAHKATFEELEALPEPKKLGSVHNPIPHALLVRALRVEAQERGYDVSREQFALGMEGSALFGVMDLMPAGVVDVTDRGMSLGFRNSTNATLAIKVVAGTRVFVCDNLALSGDLIAVLRRNTLNLDLEEALKVGFEKFLQHASALDIHVARLQAAAITDMAAKAKVFDIFAARIVPVHLFDDVEAAYFRPTDEMLDCQPRTEWGLHNAFTRAIKKLSAPRGFAANVALARAFRMTAEEVSESPAAVTGEVVN
jgi:hypothetical protein